MNKGKLTMNITEDFSMYGEPVNVVLPTECNTVSHLGASAPGLPLASVAPDPLDADTATASVPEPSHVGPLLAYTMS